MVDFLSSQDKTGIVFKLNYLPSKLWFWNFAVNHGHINEEEEVNKGGFFDIKIWHNLEGNTLFLPLIVFPLFFVRLLKADVVPLEHHVVTMVHEGVVVLNSDLNIGNVFNTEEIAIWKVLNDKGAGFFRLCL